MASGVEGDPSAATGAGPEGELEGRRFKCGPPLGPLPPEGCRRADCCCCWPLPCGPLGAPGQLLPCRPPWPCGCWEPRPCGPEARPCSPAHYETWMYHQGTSKARVEVLQKLLVLQPIACGQSCCLMQGAGMAVFQTPARHLCDPGECTKGGCQPTVSAHALQQRIRIGSACLPEGLECSTSASDRSNAGLCPI